ncbi:MAG: efflux RND transporter periplasmic adaptor subunit [Cyclobacteriaceae bacterium]|jgi:cobalt-zinc-cadmium efflux system membrane fusion protein
MKRILLIAFVALSCQPSEKKQEPVPTATTPNHISLSAEQRKVAAIQVGRLETRTISQTLIANGKLDVPPQQMVSISLPIGGFLKSTDLLQGSRVTKGQVLARVESLDYVQLQQDYREAVSQHDFAAADFQRQSELARENVNAQKTLQQAKRENDLWATKVAALREKLQLLNISPAAVEQGVITRTIELRSPLSGFVTHINGNIGKFIPAGEALFELIDTEHLHVELTVFEKDLPFIRTGQKVKFTLANETREREAEVYLIGREIMPDRTVRIHCHQKKDDAALVPGMFVRARIESESRQLTCIAEQAVVNYENKNILFVALSDLEFELVEVETGPADAGCRVVYLPEKFSANTPDIVVSGAYTLLSKIKNQED